MSISPEHLALGRESYKQIKKYETLRQKLMIAYLIPMGWLANSIIHYEIKSDAWNLFQIIFWPAVLIYIIIMTFRKRRVYLKNLTILADLRRQYGPDISFEEESEVSSTSQP